jgi:hypothetical protein
MDYQGMIYSWFLMFIIIYASMWFAGFFVARNMTDVQLLYLALAATTGLTIVFFAK